MDRRTFVRRLPIVSASAAGISRGTLTGVLTTAVSACGGFHYVTGMDADDRITIPTSAFAASDYALVESVRSPLPLYVHRHGPGEFSAVLAECTHRGCQPDPAGDRLVCPCHGSEFTTRGEVIEGPADRSLPRFDVTASEETITIWWSRRTG